MIGKKLYGKIPQHSNNRKSRILIQTLQSKAVKLFLNYKSRSDDGKAWITYKVRGNKGIRSTLKQMPNTESEEEPFIVSSSTDFTLHKVKSRSFVVKIRDRKFKVMAPTATYNSIHTKSVSCLDVSDGGLGVSVGDDGMFVWETDNGLIRVSDFNLEKYIFTYLRYVST